MRRHSALSRHIPTRHPRRHIQGGPTAPLAARLVTLVRRGSLMRCGASFAVHAGVASSRVHRIEPSVAFGVGRALSVPVDGCVGSSMCPQFDCCHTRRAGAEDRGHELAVALCDLALSAFASRPPASLPSASPPLRLSASLPLCLPAPSRPSRPPGASEEAVRDRRGPGRRRLVAGPKATGPLVYVQ